MDIKAAKSRVRELRRRMREKGLGCMIVTGQENVTYLTGFLGHDSWVIIGRGVCLVTDSRYTEQARSECVGCRIVERKGDIARAVGGIVNRSDSIGVVGIEKTCTLAVAGVIRKNLNARVKPVSGLVESIRQIKDPSEVACIQKAAKGAWIALAKTIVHLRTGITESEAAGMLEYQIRRLGLQVGFDTIVCFGANGSRNHHQPGSRKLRASDTILIDFGAKYRGYTSDTTRSFVYGKASKAYEKAYYTVLAAQQAAIDKIKAGVKLSEVDKAARDVIADAGLEVYGHGTGHGLGLAVHEIPFFSKTAKGRLQAGQLVTVEPGIYVPGKFGIRIEDDVLVTETGCRIVSKDTELGFSSRKMPVIKSR